MAASKVPTLLVLTGCENELPMHQWVDDHRQAFNAYNYKELVATCFAQGGALESHFAPLRAHSRRVTLDAISKFAMKDPYLLYGGTTGRSLQDSLFQLWNEFVDLAKLPAKYRRQSNEGAYALLKRLGVPEKAAQLAIKHIPDLIGDLGGKLPVPGSSHAARALATWLIKKITGNK